MLSQTSVFSSIGGAELNGGSGVKYRKCNTNTMAIDGAECGAFFNNLSKYFKISKDKVSYNAKWLDNSPETGYVNTLLNGVAINGPFYSDDPNISNNGLMKGMVASLRVDVNGSAKPNIFGRDIFYIFVGNNGLLYPKGTKEQSKLEYNNYTSGYWNGTEVWRNCKADGKSKGAGCAARIVEEGWKMKY